MRFSKFKRDFRQTIKDMGYSVRIGMDYQYLTVSDDKDEIVHTEWSDKDNFLIMDSCRINNNLVFEECMKYWLAHAKEHKQGILYVRQALIRSKGTLEKLGFKPVAEHIKLGKIRCIYPSGSVEDMILETQEGFIDNVYMVNQSITELINEVTEKSPTSVFKWNCTLRDLFDIEIYHHGFHGLLRFQFYRGFNMIGLSLWKNGTRSPIVTHTFKIDEIHEIKSVLLKDLNDIYKKQRLQNVFQPPMYHFDRFMSKTHFIKSISKEIFDVLLQTHDADEIELRLSQVEQPNQIYVDIYRHGFDVRIVEILNTLFLYDRAEQRLYHHKVCEVEKLFIEFENRIKNNFRALCGNSLNSFKEEVNVIKKNYDEVMKGEFISPRNPDLAASYSFGYGSSIRIATLMDRIFVSNSKTKYVTNFSFQEIDSANEAFIHQLYVNIIEDNKEKIENFKNGLSAIV